MADLIKPGPSSNESLRQISSSKERGKNLRRIKNKLIVKKFVNWQLMHNLKLWMTSYLRVHVNKSLIQATSMLTMIQQGEPSMQIVNCQNISKCACCTEVCHFQHKINKYSLKVDNQQSQIMYLKSITSFPLTYVDIHDQPEQCSQINKLLNAAEQPSIQPGASDRFLVRLSKLTCKICLHHCRRV